MIRILVLFCAVWLIVATPICCFGQVGALTSIDGGEYLRDLEIRKGVTPTRSYCLRPIYLNLPQNDTTNTSLEGVHRKKGWPIKFAILPFRVQQRYNSNVPYGWNDGAMIPAKGYQVMTSSGIDLSWGKINFKLQPELVFAENKAAPGFSSSFPDSIWARWYRYQNSFDAPDRFGNKPYFKVLPGQSSLKFNSGNISIGVSTENLWWGPGIRNALLMSNNAPGFPHLTFNTRHPVTTKLGSVEWQVISGLLNNSGFLPADTGRTYQGVRLYQPKRNEKRYINAAVISWQPKWTPGLFLGISRSFYQYRSDVGGGLNGYFPIIGATFRDNSEQEAVRGRDQLLSLFFRLALPESRAEVYMEYGRNDRALNGRDIIQEPEHARAYILGLRKFYQASKKKDFLLFFEITQLQLSSTFLVREVGPWYTHATVNHGYTHLGQVVGAGIGPAGSNSQTAGITWYKKEGIGKSSLVLERIVRNNDLFYEAFAGAGDFTRHWVDLSLNYQKRWQFNKLLLGIDAGIIRSYNYQWRLKETVDGKKDVHNLHLNFSMAYQFQ